MLEFCTCWLCARAFVAVPAFLLLLSWSCWCGLRSRALWFFGLWQIWDEHHKLVVIRNTVLICDCKTKQYWWRICKLPEIFWPTQKSKFVKVWHGDFCGCLVHCGSRVASCLSENEEYCTYSWAQKGKILVEVLPYTRISLANSC